jgi:hypothetical protein
LKTAPQLTETFPLSKSTQSRIGAVGGLHLDSDDDEELEELDDDELDGKEKDDELEGVENELELEDDGGECLHLLSQGHPQSFLQDEWLDELLEELEGLDDEGEGLESEDELLEEEDGLFLREL